LESEPSRTITQPIQSKHHQRSTSEKHSLPCLVNKKASRNFKEEDQGNTSTLKSLASKSKTISLLKINNQKTVPATRAVQKFQPKVVPLVYQAGYRKDCAGIDVGSEKSRSEFFEQQSQQEGIQMSFSIYFLIEATSFKFFI